MVITARPVLDDSEKVLTIRGIDDTMAFFEFYINNSNLDGGEVGVAGVPSVGSAGVPGVAGVPAVASSGPQNWRLPQNRTLQRLGASTR